MNPTTPEVAWNAANFFLIQGDTSQALDALALVIRNDPNMVASALSLSWRASGDVNHIESRLPPDPEIYIEFLKVLVDREQWRAANDVWLSLWALKHDFDPRSVLFYIDALLAKRDVTAAQAAWDKVLTSSLSMTRYVSPGNLVVNAGFDRELLNAGFDWRYTALPNVAILLDSTQFHDGNESLLITYSGPSEQVGISQLVPVVPGTNYTASAWVKSEELETANGPRLSVVDPHTNLEYARSEETLGTTSWHQVTTQFTAGPDTNLVLLQFSRQPSETRIQGRFWIDSVFIGHNSLGKPDE